MIDGWRFINEDGLVFCEHPRVDFFGPQPHYLSRYPRSKDPDWVTFFIRNSGLNASSKRATLAERWPNGEFDPNGLYFYLPMADFVLIKLAATT